MSQNAAFYHRVVTVWFVFIVDFYFLPVLKNCVLLDLLKRYQKMLFYSVIYFSCVYLF